MAWACVFMRDIERAVSVEVLVYEIVHAVAVDVFVDEVRLATHCDHREPALRA